MSLKPTPIPSVPEETARVTRAVFPRGNTLMQLRDTLGTIYTDEAFADLFPTHGQPAEAPWRLALVTVFQFLEHLTGRQAADAVRSRLDWKYALSLELTDPGFDHTVLSEFRTRLVKGNAELRLLDLLLEQCRPRDAQRDASNESIGFTGCLPALARRLAATFTGVQDHHDPALKTSPEPLHVRVNLVAHPVGTSSPKIVS